VRNFGWQKGYYMQQSGTLTRELTMRVIQRGSAIPGAVIPFLLLALEPVSDKVRGGRRSQ